MWAHHSLASLHATRLVEDSGWHERCNTLTLVDNFLLSRDFDDPSANAKRVLYLFKTTFFATDGFFFFFWLLFFCDKTKKRGKCNMKTKEILQQKNDTHGSVRG